MSGYIDDLEKLSIEYGRTIKNDRSKIGEFVKSEIVAKMRKQEQLIYSVEEYCLPHVTALICNSNPSLVSEKGEKYSYIKALYCFPSNKTQISKSLGLELRAFEDFIICYADEYILEECRQYIETISKETQKSESGLRICNEEIAKLQETIEQQIRSLERKKKKLEKKQLAKNKKKSDAAPQDISDTKSHSEDEKRTELKDEAKTINDELAKLQEEIEKLTASFKEKNIKLKKKEEQKIELEKKLEVNRKELERLEPYYTLIITTIEQYDSQLRHHRQLCYEYLKTGGMKTEEEFLNELLEGDKAIDYKEKFLECGIDIKKIYQLLGTDKYVTREMLIITLLLKSGIITIDDNELKRYLIEKPQILCSYLCENEEIEIQGLLDDNIYHVLFDLAIDLEADNNHLMFSALWDGIESVDIWRYIQKYIGDETKLAKLVCEIRGRVLRAFLDSLEDSGINMPSFVHSLTCQPEINSDLVFRIVQNYERKLSKANRDIRRANKRMEIQESSGAERVYSAMYEAMDKLEILTFDIKKYDGTIDKENIADQMIECVAKYRKALEVLEVFPLESIDNWKALSPIDFNSNKHRYENGYDVQDGQVLVKTLGYRYSIADPSGSGETEDHYEFAKVEAAKR